MINVSNAWKQMFNGNLIGEALIKFVVQDYGTLTRADIFSYKFSGRVNAITQDYPQYNATINLVMRNDYLNFNNFIGKSVDIYYGFIINGSEEYHKALTLYIDDMEISDDGRVATWYLKSIFAYLTATEQIELPQYLSDIDNLFHYDLPHFCSNHLSHTYSITGSIRHDRRALSPRITIGEALQELSFVNCKTLYVDSANTIQMKEMSFNNFELFSEHNLLNYPHIAKADKTTNVIVQWFDPNDTELTYTDVKEADIIAITKVGYNWVGSQKVPLDQDDLFILTDFCSNAKTGGTGTITNYNIGSHYNDEVNPNIIATASATSSLFKVRGYSYSNYVNIQDGYFTIFNININSQTHANQIGSWVSSYLSGNQTIELKVNFDPRFELLDCLITNKNKRFIIEELTIDYKNSYNATIKGRYWGDSLIAPKVEIDHYSDHDYSIIIKNPNAIAVDLYIEYSGGTLYFQLDPFENFYMDDNHYPQLMNSFQAKAYQDLQADVYCYFENPETGDPSDNAIILEAD